MELFLCTKLLLVLSIVKAEQSSNSKHDEKNTTKRGVIVVNSPKTRHNAGTKKDLLVIYTFLLPDKAIV